METVVGYSQAVMRVRLICSGARYAKASFLSLLSLLPFTYLFFLTRQEKGCGGRGVAIDGIVRGLGFDG